MDTSTIIPETIDRLRTAVAAVRAAPATHRTVQRFADDIEAVLDNLHRDLERNAPVQTRLAGAFYALGDPPAVLLKEGDHLELRREPDNRADANAIAMYAVNGVNGVKCGYLPRGVASELAPALDSGLEASAVVVRACGTDIEVEVSGPAVTGRDTSSSVFENVDF